MTPERAKELLPIIQAFSEGKKIEYKGVHDLKWLPCSEPAFLGMGEYRIAKEKKWYRVALCANCTTTADNEQNEKSFEEAADFIRWLTDRVYYDIE